MRLTRLRPWLLMAALVAAVSAPLPSLGASRVAAPPPSLAPAGYTALVGPMHEHSGYSDGYPGSTPGSYYSSAKALGNDFLVSGEHSDNLALPVVASEECLTPQAPACVGGDPDLAKSLQKWSAMAAYADEATVGGFVGARGFEWTSDRFGHINVYFSKNYTNAKVDSGYASMAPFYAWLTRRAELGGGADGVATFNHPGAKKLQGVGDSDPGVNWDDFAYVPAADDQMVGLEVYNDDEEVGSKGSAVGYYVHALDQGWHLGAVGAEDLGHRPADDWGGPGWAKTVLLTTERSTAAMREAMRARRFYAVRRPDTRLAFTVDGALMGSRLARPAGRRLAISAQAVRTGRSRLVLEVVTSGGKVVATGADRIRAAVPADPAQKYYFLRVRDGKEVIGYSSPIWVGAALAGRSGEWMAGDLHVHTCYSHDAYCPPDDYNTAPEEFYTLGGDPQERFLEASLRGLDYLALTDHHSDDHPADSGFKSTQDPGFGTSGVVGVAGYENSIGGHAQMLGARRVYPAGDKKAGAINAMARALRRDGGVFQANHPADGLTRPLTSCSDLSGMHWSYGLTVPVDTVEVWNTTNLAQPPMPVGISNADSVFFWECWLSRGQHVAATGGSDSHWLTLAPVQGVGNPTTWVFASERSQRGVVGGIRDDRTSISILPPGEGGALLLLEADADRDGVYESMIGDTVPRGVPMRVRATGLLGAGFVEVRANGATLLTGEPLLPGSAVEFTAPAAAGWVRAELYAEDAREQRRAACEPLIGDQTTYCRNRVGLLGLTSAIYLR